MYYTLEKTAEILELTPGEVNRLRESNKLRAFRDGASWKFRKEDVEKYLTDLIRERSKPAAPAASDLLNDSDEEELPTMLADSSSFDAMIDATAETLEIKTNAPSEEEFSLELPADDDLQIVDEPQIEEAPVLEAQADDLALPPEDDDFALEPADEPAVEPAAPEADFAPELSLDAEDDDLLLAEEPAAEPAPAPEADFAPELSLDDEDDDLLLAEELAAEPAPAPEADFAPEAAADDDLLLVDEAQADDDSASVFSLESDDANALSGASDDDLLHLGSDSGLSLLDDVDLSGSNVSLDGDDVVLGGSGSGSGLSLGGDSGLSLLDDDADDFALASAPAEESSFAPEVDEDDDSIFELADEPKPSAVLELEQNADPDTATVLGVGEDFQLEADSTTYEVSESESASQIIDVAEENDPFFTTDDSDDSSFDPFAAPTDGADANADANPFGDFGAVDENPFATAVETPADGGFGGFAGGSNNDEFGGFDGGSNDGGFGGADSFDASADAAPVAARAPQTEYTGKDFLFLVPCLLFLLLATIGAYELCRTIWSYEEGAFDLGGPVLDMIANMTGLAK